ncbi:CCE1 [Candida margitis]|uniref:CCE1 n=1 Tax=Candida margitis TaxID=1775924 RepID=UPI00222687F0|nr:CCE1 [Candida margitis]KAI5960715.1 CCE1 [Candida margitis]
MNKQQITNLAKHLHRYKIPILNDIALHCGSPILGTTKASRIEGIIAQYQLYLTQWHNLACRNTLSIDIGIKNFSYCKTTTKKTTATRPTVEGATDATQQNLTSLSAWPVIVTHWQKLNLDTKYGSLYTHLLHQDTILDTKRYLNHITNHLVDDILAPNLSNVKIMEIQRTRSNNNAKTLPTILTNHILENLILSKMYPSLVVPMTSMKLIHFWLYRFITKESINSGKLKKNNKIIRRDLILAWFGKLYQLEGYENNNIRTSEGTKSIGSSSQLTMCQLLDHLHLSKGDKTDDLIDSLLYNLCINCQLNHLYQFHTCLQQQKDDDDYNLIEFVENANQFHLDLIQPVIDKYQLTVK